MARTGWLSQGNVTCGISGHIDMLTCDSLHSWRLFSAAPLGDQAAITSGILGHGAGGSLPVGQHYKVTECALSQVGTRSDMTIDVARM